MNQQPLQILGVVGFSTSAIICICIMGCHDAQADKKPHIASGTQATQENKQPGVKQIKIGKNVTLEIDGDKRRVLVNATVCMRRGMLEQFLCKKATKEHESIVSADVDAKDIHTALLAAGAEPGTPVQFRPKYKPASGTVIKVFIQHDQEGKVVKVPAQEWIRNIKTEKILQHDWVFAGSMLFTDPLNPKAPPHYAANEGDVICVSNFETAMLDLPISSSDLEGEQMFEAFTERIPPENTSVVIILEPVIPAKK